MADNVLGVHQQVEERSPDLESTETMDGCLAYEPMALRICNLDSIEPEGNRHLFGRCARSEVIRGVTSC